MQQWRAFCETVHVLALALWLGVLVAAGVFAMTIFPTARALKPALPDYSAFSGEHALIIGGQIAQNVFLATDTIVFACAMIAMLTLAALVTVLGVPNRRPAVIIRIVALSFALACAAGSLIVVNPSLNTALRSYWAAAKAGDNTSALAHKASADELHPLASRLLSGGAIAVFIGLSAGVWSIARPWKGTPEERVSRYPTPSLLKGPS
jgi:hypothetical protein